MKKLSTFWIATSLSASLPVSAQTTYFQQNFSAGGTPANYVSATPDNTQFNGIAGLSATITNNAVQFSRPTDSGTGYISRNADFAGPPSSLHIQFSFEVPSSDVTVPGTSAVILYVGSNFSAYAGSNNPNVGDMYARMGFNLSSTGSGQFQIRNMPGQGSSGNSANFSGKQTITFAMNNTGFDNFKYVSPTGSLDPLPNDTYDIWVGNVKVFDNQPVTNPGQTISNFKFRVSNGAGVIQIGNFLMRDISGALPVSLLSFTAKPEGDRVQLAWTTTSERDADRFVVERSPDLGEYVTVGEIAAKGTTDVRQEYGLTDLNPQPGANYYRLKQIDFDGTAHLYKPVSVIVRADEPVVTAYPNPTSNDRIHLRLWNADDAAVRLLTPAGQPVSARLERRPGEADLVPDQPLPTGLYLLEARTNGWKRRIRVLVR